jgi:hypothetical protein
VLIDKSSRAAAATGTLVVQMPMNIGLPLPLSSVAYKRLLIPWRVPVVAMLILYSVMVCIILSSISCEFKCSSTAEIQYRLLNNPYSDSFIEVFIGAECGHSDY